MSTVVIRGGNPDAYFECTMECVRASSERENLDAFGSIYDHIMWSLEGEEYSDLENLLGMLKNYSDKISPDILLGAIHYMEPASDKIAYFTSLKDKIEQSCSRRVENPPRTFVKTKGGYRLKEAQRPPGDGRGG